MSFDAIGRVATQIDAKGQVKTMTYDPVGQTLETRYADGTIVSQMFDRIGRRTTMVDWAGATTYAFTPRSELSGKTDPGGLAQSYEYDANSNRTAAVNPDGGRYTTTYDPLDRQSVIQEPTGDRISFAYDPDSRKTLAQDPSLARTYEYDKRSQLTTMIDSGATVVTLVDTYNAGGSRTSRARDGIATTWSYDPAQRLTAQSTLAGTATFTMDEVGNVITKQHQGGAPQTYMFDPADRITTMIEGSGVTTYAFDPNGNNTVEQTNTKLTTNTWDPENRLTGIQWKQKSSSGLSTYTFSGDGLRRTAQEQGAGISTMVWDGSDYIGEVR